MSDRREAERFARNHHYFWLPCPSCGEMFGGHEAQIASDLGSRLGLFSGIPDPKYPPGSGRGLGICPACVVAGKGASVLDDTVVPQPDSDGIPCAAHPSTGFRHHDGPCRCFIGGPAPEFEQASAS